MPKAIGVVEFRDHTGEVLDRVQGGQRYIIHRFGRPVAGLVTTTDLERLEEPVSEERASYTTEADDQGQDDLVTALASAALARRNLNKREARRALLLAALLLEDGQP